MSPWTLAFEGFEPDREGQRETLCTLGNGYFATRGAAPEAWADDVHYPGTYLAGGYSRLVSEVAGHTVENEDLVNLPNWLALSFREPEGEWFDLRTVAVLDHRQELDLRRGVLSRTVRFRSGEGRVSTLTERRFVGMHEPHLAGLESTLVAENWSGRLVVRSGLDGRVENRGVPRYRLFRGNHLVPLTAQEIDPETVALDVETRGSHLRVAQAARTRIHSGGEAVASERRPVREPGFIAHDIEVDVREGLPLTVEKIVTLFSSRDHGINEPTAEACEWLQTAGDFDQHLDGHVLAWDQLWRRFDIRVEDSDWAQLVLRLHIFHLAQTANPNIIDLDVGVPARGLHGEAYRGHVFWDELFVLPLLNLRLPVLSRTLLEYRSRRLPRARWVAKEAGLRGAMFPWQSGSDGREESQFVHLNPRSGRWVPDHSHLQRHVGIAIAYNVWQHHQMTADLEYLRFRGGPLILDIARFWASLAIFNESSGRYEIRGVMGPDEYHDAYPYAENPGLNNNAYTNVMTAWVMARALDVLDSFPPHHREELIQELGLTEEEFDRWEDMTGKMYVPFTSDGIISQFQGWDDLEELDWIGYVERYGDLQRLDRILEAEGDTPNRYKLSKQADVLMLFYLLSPDELRDVFARLGYPFDPGADVPRNTEYYLKRTSHGSTLSRLVHSWVLARIDRPRSWEFFLDALRSDVDDLQGGSTAEGIHLGAMAGSVDLVQRCYGGIEAHDDVLWVDPLLPDKVSAIEFEVHYRGHRLGLHIASGRLRVDVRPGPAGPIRVGLVGDVIVLSSGETREVALHPQAVEAVGVHTEDLAFDAAHPEAGHVG